MVKSSWVKIMIKMIVTDLDGSLLNDEKQLPTSFKQTVDLIKSKGITLVIATGRSYYNVANIFKDYLEDIYFICENGCHVVFQQQTIYSQSLDSALLKEVFAVFNNIGKGVMLPCGSKGTYHVRHSEDKNDFKEVVKYYDNFIEIDDIAEVDDDIYKISFCCNMGTNQNLMPQLSQFSTSADVYVSAFQWMDITKKDESKGKALDFVQKHLNIDVATTIIFGDYVNDLSLADYAGISFCMQDGHPSVKDRFDFITYSNNEDGVCRKIKELLCE